MRDVEFYALKATVEKLVGEVEQMKAIVSNNAAAASRNDEILADNLESASLLGMALLDELCANEATGVVKSNIIKRIQEMSKPEETEDSTVSIPENVVPFNATPEASPHDGAFIFKST